MKLSLNTGTLINHGFSCEEAVNLLQKAGFDAIDFSFFKECFYNEATDLPEFKEYFLNLKALAEQKGMCFNQAHAPFHSSFTDENKTKEMFNNIIRSMRNASYLGIDTIIVHPKQHLDFSETGVPEKLFEMNMDFYNSLKPYCEEYNIKVALENMWQKPKGRKIIHSTCSKPDEFIKYLDTLDSEWFVGCLDIGHACLVCEDLYEFITKLGSKRLKALHVHDVDGIDDSHTLPYYGIIDWDKVAKALKDINYDGDFTYEAGCFIENLPNELFPSALHHMAQTGRYIMNKIKE